jgi:hypothetical protein
MWELRSKNQFGQVEQITKESIFTKQDVFDNINPNGNGYNKAELTVEYTVEWLPERNFEAFEKSQLANSSINPWELKNEYLTDSLGLAIRMMCLRELDEHSGKPQLYMYIKDKNGNDAEAVAEIPNDTVPILRNMVKENINRKLDNQQKIIDALEKEIELYKAFIKKAHAEKMFDDSRRENL